MEMKWFKKMINKIKHFIHKGEDMPQGLQVFDEHGNITIDVTDRLTQVIGIIRITSPVGSIDVDVDGNRKLFYTISKSHSLWIDGEYIMIDGHKICWDFSRVTPLVANGGIEVVYGVV